MEEKAERKPVRAVKISSIGNMLKYVAQFMRMSSPKNENYSVATVFLGEPSATSFPGSSLLWRKDWGWSRVTRISRGKLK